jgi:threonine-phosphate decarboxylase
MTNHGGDIYSFMEKKMIAQNDLIDFSASINPLGTPKAVIHEIQKGLKNLIHYPDMNATKLREKIGNVYNIDPASIVCGNGCAELIHLVPRTMGFQKVLIVQPTFSDYARACKIARTNCVIVDHILEKENGFVIEPQKLIDQAIDSTVEAVYLCNPNNPTGRLLEKDIILGITQMLRKQKIYLIIDESFIDFSSGESLSDAVGINPYLMVLRSMTKFYALAGLRLGWGVFPLHIAAMLRECKEPWSVNTLAQAAGIAALEEVSYKDKTRELIKKQRQILAKGLKDLGIEYIPSDANYYLFYTSHAQKIAEYLANNGILVRGCSNFKGLDHRYLRIAVKSPKNNRTLLKYMKDCFA